MLPVPSEFDSSKARTVMCQGGMVLYRGGAVLVPTPDVIVVNNRSRAINNNNNNNNNNNDNNNNNNKRPSHVSSRTNFIRRDWRARCVFEFPVGQDVAEVGWSVVGDD